jgi:glycosyltransferase involved in cell wall biosynthesis
LGGVGVIRTSKFSKYLPNFGWGPIILTTKDPQVTEDPNFLGESLTNIKVFRSVNIPVEKIFKGKYDIHPGWIPDSIHLGAEIIKKEKVDVVYAPYPYAENVFIAAWLKKLTGKPLIIDYEDAWTNNWFRYPRTQFIIQKKIEEWIHKRSDRIIVTNKSIRENLKNEFPLLQKDIVLIRNGFDPEDFESVAPFSFGRFTFLYVGSMTSLRANVLKTFLYAIKDLNRSDFQVIFLGELHGEIEELVKNLRLTHVVHHIDTVPHKEAIRYMLGANILVLVTGIKYHLSSKIYEYLATGREIMNLSECGSEAAEFLGEIGRGFSVSPNAAAIKEAINHYLEAKSDFEEFKQLNNSITEFSYENLTKQLSIQLDNLLSYKFLP